MPVNSTRVEKTETVTRLFDTSDEKIGTVPGETVVSGVCRKQTLFPTPGAKVTVVAGTDTSVSRTARSPKPRRVSKKFTDPAIKQMGIDKVLVPIRLSGKYYQSGRFDCAPLIQLDIPKPKRPTRKP